MPYITLNEQAITENDARKEIGTGFDFYLEKFLEMNKSLSISNIGYKTDKGRLYFTAEPPDYTKKERI